MKKDYTEVMVPPTHVVVTVEVLLPLEDTDVENTMQELVDCGNSYGTAVITSKRLILDTETEAVKILQSRSI